MIDGLYLKSLFATLIAYLVFVVLLVTFVAISGIYGVFLIFLVIVLLMCYFYGCFRRIYFRKKGRRP
jgi:hypothetical protein